MSSPTISPREAAKALGIGEETVRAVIRAGGWKHIGAEAIQHGSRWTYVIPRAGFERMVRGDISVVVNLHQHRHIDADAIGKAVLTAVSAAVDAA